MSKKLILSFCAVVMVILGIWQLYELMTFERADSIVETVTPYRRTSLAQIRYHGPDGTPYTGQVNAEGRKVGETLPVMFAADNPTGTLKAYSPVLYLIPVICLLFPIPLIWLIWNYQPAGSTRSLKSQ